VSEPQPGPPALPPRDPRPFLVHLAVDAAVAFLLSVIVLLILGASIWIVLIVAAIAGLAAAPYTRRAEARALAARARDA
jgi:hypothetical protein